MIDPGSIAIVRFPDDAIPVPSVAKVIAYRGDQALVAKHRGMGWNRQRTAAWGKPRWVPVANIAREATDRERVTGTVIERIPPRVAA